MDYFVSIHRNSYPIDNAVSGVESLVYDLSGIKYEMAEDINDQLETIGFRNLGVKSQTESGGAQADKDAGGPSRAWVYQFRHG